MQEDINRPIKITDACKGEIALELSVGDRKLETGGALFGIDDGETLTVTHAAGPGPNAVHRDSYFLRDLTYTQMIADVEHKINGTQWIGEWHTHPNGPNVPSDLDIHTYANHLLDRELNFTEFVAIIVAPNESTSGAMMWCWVLGRHDGEITLSLASID